MIASAAPRQVNLKSSLQILDKDIPLPFSRDAMKKAGMTIDFKTDSATVFNSNVPLHVTQSGHYTLPLTSPLQLLAKQNGDPHTKIVLTVLGQKPSGHKPPDKDPLDKSPPCQKPH